MKDEADALTAEMFPKAGDIGMAKALVAEGPEWMLRALSAIRFLADRGGPFTSDDVRAMIERPRHANAIGAVMRMARKRGVIEPVGAEPSSRPGRRGGMVRTWRKA